ncbi:MAG: protein translocase subunit SecD [Vicinamibacteria bacterium]|nr:protein translocase subunit SecD [Vicinamibacteria bacterium]
MPTAFEQPFVQWLIASAALAGLAYAFIRKELRVRAIFYGAFLVACIVALWPPFEMKGRPGKINLGLDLRGGVHLVLKVKTDDALNATVDDRIQDVREELNKKSIAFEAVIRRTSSSYEVSGVEPSRVKDVREVLRDFSRSTAAEPGGWKIDERGGRFAVVMSDVLMRNLNERTIAEAQRTLERRVNQLGVAEPVIARHGSSGDQILVQLPGVADVEQAKRVIQTTAQLLLKLVEDSAGSQEALLDNYQGQLPAHLEIVRGAGDRPGESVFYLVQKTSVITGRDLKNARASVDQMNQPAVSFSLNPQGARRFGEATGKNIGRRLAIVLDGYVESAPTIEGKIRSDGQITGRFTTQEADELAKVLRAGALPATLEYLQEMSVGASLGRDSIRSGVLASIAGMSFIALFMLFYYRLSGVNAVVALIANLVILLGTMAYLGATLTLPGIAGVILTIGVGVDTNVLVFERIREELRHGKTVKAAIANGFERVWIIILDTHATALIAATFLFTFGTGPIKGFAVTLVIGLIANVFASYFVSQFIFEWILGKRPVERLSIGTFDVVKSPKFDFLGKRKIFITLSLLLIVGGIAWTVRQGGMNYGVEFSGGTQLIVGFEARPAIERIRAAVEKVSPGAVIQTYDALHKNQVLIRITEIETPGDSRPGEKKQSSVARILKALDESYGGNPVQASSYETVGPIAGAELRRKAIYLVCLGLLFQLIYIGIRFKGAIWGTAATVAVLHDVLVTLGLLVVLDFEISLNIIAALLTLVGYSVNDTIVIFDRARENLRHQRKEPLYKILQDALNQTLSRTLISNGTTFLAVLGLYLFGGQALKGFSFAMVVGILIGTYSTIYIAGPVVLAWERLSRGAAARQA